jgi:2-polyprenyl-3-methyl-5-hydroxy-6-metoxy-1,4-benzoquinol methylase
MDTLLKNNVNEFEKDVMRNGGYRYTTNPQYSSFIANKRLTDTVIENILPSYKTLIDIGCGDGVNTGEISKVFPSLNIDATDPACKAIELAKEKYQDITFFVSNILDINTFEKKVEKYDLAVLRGVLHHLTDPVIAIRNSLTLSDNVLIIEPNGNNPILKIIEKKSKYHIEHEEKSFTSKKLSKYCGEAGGAVKKLYFVGFIPFFFPEIASKIILFFQPFLEKIPVLRYFFSGQIIILCQKNG